jgi:hypothetical protein
MENNPKLWLYLIDPQADERKRSILDLHSDFFDRIITLELKAEDALKERVLVENLNSLEFARQQEEEAKRGLLQNSVLDSDSWQPCIFNYKKIRHFDRIRSAIEEIMKYEYRQLQGRIPIQWMLLDLSIKFGSEYLTKGKKEDARFWLQMFKDCWAMIEFSYVGPTAKTDLVPEDQLPSWHKSFRADVMGLEEIQKTEVTREIENAATILCENGEMKTILLQMPEFIEQFYMSHWSGNRARYLDFVMGNKKPGLFKLSADLMNQIGK